MEFIFEIDDVDEWDKPEFHWTEYIETVVTVTQVGKKAIAESLPYWLTATTKAPASL